MRDPIVWLDGILLPASEARISPFDHGLLVGDGVFETLRVYDSIPFAWTRHYERLTRSAGGLGLTTPDSDVLREAADAVLHSNALHDARLRLTVTGGPAPVGSERGTEPPTVLVIASEAAAWPPSTDVVTVPWTRNEGGAAAGLKTVSYAENVRALAYAHDRGAGEAIFTNTRGELCEATGSNVFVVRDGEVRTPAASSGCLIGVTRALVLELCAAHGITAAEAVMDPTELSEATEAFLTSSTREVQPIASVDNRALKDVPGATTSRLCELFADLVARDQDP